MAASAPLISVPKNLYKHFAVLTLAITVCVAVFADGENKQVIEKQIEQRRASKAHAAEIAGGGRAAGFGELRDNRGPGAQGNDDTGPEPVDPQPVGVFAMGEVRADELPRLTGSPSEKRRTRKMPAVLPPGMPRLPGEQVQLELAKSPAPPAPTT